MLAGSVYWQVWGKVCRPVLAPNESDSPVGRRVYRTRHTCLTMGLNDGIPPTRVAAWAGHSVPVLRAIYARCIIGQLADVQRCIEAVQALEHVEVRPAVSGPLAFQGVPLVPWNRSTYGLRPAVNSRFQPDIGHARRVGARCTGRVGNRV